MTLLKAINVSKTGPSEFRLSDINFRQSKLEKIAIAGETGAGKSTLLKLVAGMLQPDAGELIFEKSRIHGPSDQLVPGHPGIAYLSQHFELQKSLRVGQVLHYSNTLSDADANTLYAVCQIDHVLHRRTDELSGGERQRVAICRLLISSPRLLLLDEPFTHLDMMHKQTLKAVIRDIGEKLRITCMLVSHDPQDTLSWADKIFVMKQGKIIQKADPETVYNKPVNVYTGGLFGKYNLIGREDGKNFSQSAGLKRAIAMLGNDRKIFLRPEHFKVAPKSSRSLRGKVIKVLFLGSHEEAEILLGKQIITVRAGNGTFTEGKTAYLGVATKDFWVV